MTISASGRDPRDPTRIIHAISISQPVTSWTVVREYDDFVQVGNKISMVNPSLPPCPSLLPDRTSVAGGSTVTTNDPDEIVHVRNVLQEWLITVLLFPGARESPALRHFMTFGANQIPPQLEGTIWLHFTTANNNTVTKGVKNSPTATTSSSMSTIAARSTSTINCTPSNTSVRSNSSSSSGATPATAAATVRTTYAEVVAATTVSASISPCAAAVTASSPSSTTPSLRQQQKQQQQTHNMTTLDDEMEMDFMFDTGGSGGDEEDDDDDSDYGDDELIPYAQRYPPPDEVVTQEDVELMESLEEIEMIEDVGSLAQSLGASHLGRSLQLQAQITRQNHHQQQPYLAAAAPPTMTLTGITLGGAATTTTTTRPVVATPAQGVGGGIESAIMKNVDTGGIHGLGDSFYQQKPISAPRLDSFKMIKVIGKGSFGKFYIKVVCFPSSFFFH